MYSFLHSISYIIKHSMKKTFVACQQYSLCRKTFAVCPMAMTACLSALIMKQEILQWRNIRG